MVVVAAAALQPLEMVALVANPVAVAVAAAQATELILAQVALAVTDMFVW